MTQLLYIDLFCGAGGTSTGVERARLNGDKCAHVIACVNHDPNAIASHAANHPNALHFTEDIRTLDLLPLVNHVIKERNKYRSSKVVLWASLECTNFSKAKGGKPRDADSRTLAEHLFRYIDALQPDYIYIENVEEFMYWGDLDENGKPISRDEGRLYMQWVNDVRKRGYDFEHRLLNAANYGARTSRTRFFGIFAEHGLPIVFPKATHSKDAAPDLFGSGLKPWNPVRPILDLDIVGQSIFARKKPLSERTLERIFKGLKKFIPRGKDTFLSKQYSGDPDGKNISIDEPAGTITCIDHHALVQAQLQDKTPKGRKALVTSHFFANEYSGGGQLSSIDAPMPSVLTTPKQKLVTVNQFLVNTSYQSKGGSIDEPIFTLIARMDKSPAYLATAEKGTPPEIQSTDSEFTRLIKEFMIEHNIIDIYMRMLSVTELKEAQGFPEDYVLIGTQTEQKKFIGNAVEVNMSRALCEALAKRLNQ